MSTQRVENEKSNHAPQCGGEEEKYKMEGERLTVPSLFNYDVQLQSPLRSRGRRLFRFGYTPQAKRCACTILLNI